MADQLSTQEFAAKLKQRDSRLASVPDDVLVRKVLERRPELIVHLTAPPSMPSAPSKLTEPEPFMNRVLNRVGDAAESTEQMIPNFVNKSRSNFKDGQDLGGWKGVSKMISAIPRAEGSALGDIGKGLYGVSTPGIVQRIANKDDPANIIADAGMMLAGSGEEPVKSGLESGAKMAAEGGIMAGTPVRVLSQEIAGAGKEPVLLEGMRNKAVAAERASSYEKAKTDTARENSTRMQEHAAEVEKAKQFHQKAVSEYEQSTADKKSEYANKVAKARKEWVDKAYAAKQAEQESAKIDARRETLGRSQSEYGDRLRQNIQDTYKTVKSRLDSRWNGLRSTPTKSGGGLSILGDEKGNAVDLKHGMENAEEEFLQGSPDSLKTFRDLTGWISRDADGKIDGGGEPLKPPTWNELRTHYSAMGDAMYGREIPANVFRALRYVRDEVVGGQLRDMAAKAGVGEKYSSLLRDHSQFEGDWMDTSSVTRSGGSPLAIARKAPNAATLIPQVTGRTGDLLMERLGKYRDSGASPATASAIRKLGSEIKNLPTVKIPKAPGKLELPKEPSAGESPELKLPRDPKMKTAKQTDPVDPVDPVAIRRKKLTEAAAKKFSWWDTFPPYLIERLALKNPAFREWVATQARKETPVP